MNEHYDYRLRQLEDFRKKFEPIIESLMEEKVIQRAVNEAVKKNNRLYLTWSQRIGAAIIVSLTIAQSLHDLFG